MIPLRDNVPTRTFPVVTLGLIVANAIVWFWEIGGSTSLDTDVIHYGYYPCKVEGPCLGSGDAEPTSPGGTSAFTSMFMHGGWAHIIFNMLFLWIFGNNVEDALGRVRFFLWYLVGGLAATALADIRHAQVWQRADASIPNIGASGAIAAVLGGYFVLAAARARAQRDLRRLDLPPRDPRRSGSSDSGSSFQLWQGGFGIAHPETGGGVAFFAHSGGFVFGLLTVRLVARRRPLQPSY